MKKALSFSLLRRLHAAAADRRLAAQANEGSMKALGALYDRHGAIAFSFALKLLRGKIVSAEEVMIEAFRELPAEAARHHSSTSVKTLLLVLITRPARLRPEPTLFRP